MSKDSLTIDYLVVDDDITFSQLLSRNLQKRDFTVAVANNSAEAIALTKKSPINHTILDLKIDTENGLQLLSTLLKLQPGMKIILLTGYSSIATAVEAIKLGALNYLCKPASIDEIINAFSQSENSKVTQENKVVIKEQPHSVGRLEWEHIQKVLAENEGNISATARALGMHRRTLQRKLQKRPVKS